MEEIKTKEITLVQLIETESFKAKLEFEIAKINKRRVEVMKKAGKEVRFKRSPVDYLRDNGKFSADGIKGLLQQIVVKESKLPASVRMFVSDLTYRPLAETVSEHFQRVQLESEEPATVEA